MPDGDPGHSSSPPFPNVIISRPPVFRREPMGHKLQPKLGIDPPPFQGLKVLRSGREKGNKDCLRPLAACLDSLKLGSIQGLGSV